MPAEKLRTGLIGLAGIGQMLLQAASRAGCFEIVAVGDEQSQLAEQAARQHGCVWYDDYRQLVIQNQLDCLLVTEAIHRCDEHISLAMKKRFNVLKAAPPARGFEEAAGFVRLADEQQVIFAIASIGRFSKSYLTLRKLIQTEGVENVFMVTAHCNFADLTTLPWQSDPRLAGGGVLLHDCYGIIDQIMWNFGAPQQVYSARTNRTGDRQQRGYVTEDSAVVTFKFGDRPVGNLVASRQAGPREELLKIYSKDRIFTATPQRLCCSDVTGQAVEELACSDEPLEDFVEMLKGFAGAVMRPEENRLCCSAKENLVNMAVIECAYLSARTGMPEEPARMLQVAGVDYPGAAGPVTQIGV